MLAKAQRNTDPVIISLERKSGENQRDRGGEVHLAFFSNVSVLPSAPTPHTEFLQNVAANILFLFAEC